MKNNMNFNNDFPDFKQFISSFNINDSTSFNNNKSSDIDTNPFENIDFNTILRIKQIMENMNNNKNNPRANLLLYLKPYLKPSRKQKVDQYIQLFSIGELLENLNTIGGEDSK